jgi:hypothetical protein
MAVVTKALVDLLDANLDRLNEPKDYQSIRQKMKSIRTNRKPPSIKQSPENSRRWTDDE